MAIDPQNLSWAESIVEGVAESTGYRLNKRQVRAIAQLDHAHLRIQSDFGNADTIGAIRDALTEFLRAGGLRLPFTLPVGANEVVRAAHAAYTDAVAWEQAVRSGDGSTAGFQAYRLAEFVSGLAYTTLTPYLWRDELRRQQGRNVGRTNRAGPARRHAEWLRIAREVLAADRFCKSTMEVCRRVSRRADKNPKTGKPYAPRVIFNAIGRQLTTRRKNRE